MVVSFKGPAAATALNEDAAIVLSLFPPSVFSLDRSLLSSHSHTMGKGGREGERLIRCLLPAKWRQFNALTEGTELVLFI